MPNWDPWAHMASWDLTDWTRFTVVLGLRPCTVTCINTSKRGHSGMEQRYPDIKTRHRKSHCEIRRIAVSPNNSSSMFAVGIWANGLTTNP